MNNRNKDRNEWVSEEYEKANRTYRELVASIHDIQDIDDELQDFEDLNMLKSKYSYDNAYKGKKYCAKVHKYPQYREYEIDVYNMPLPNVVERIAGPLHRLYKFDWEMDVDGQGDVTLSGNFDQDKRMMKFTINAFKGIPKCRVVKVDTKFHSYTTDVFRIKCS